jgi:dolichol kinase
MLLVGFLVLPLYFSRPEVAPIIEVLTYGLALVTAADVLRLNIGPFARLYEKFLGAFMRESEKVRLRHGILPERHTLTACLFTLFRKPSTV